MERPSPYATNVRCATGARINANESVVRGAVTALPNGMAGARMVVVLARAVDRLELGL